MIVTLAWGTGLKTRGTSTPSAGAVVKTLPTTFSTIELSHRPHTNGHDVTGRWLNTARDPALIGTLLAAHHQAANFNPATPTSQPATTSER